MICCCLLWSHEVSCLGVRSHSDGRISDRNLPVRPPYQEGGEAGLEKMMSRKRFDDWKKKINERAAYTVMLGCLAPPPFPFRAVIVAASAFQYPRHKLLSVAFVSRFARFSIVAALAIVFGRQVLSVAESPAAFWAMIGFIVLCAIATAYSVVRWIRQCRKTATKAAQPKDDPIPNK